MYGRPNAGDRSRRGICVFNPNCYFRLGTCSVVLRLRGSGGEGDMSRNSPDLVFISVCRPLYFLYAPTRCTSWQTHRLEISNSPPKTSRGTTLASVVSVALRFERDEHIYQPVGHNLTPLLPQPGSNLQVAINAFSAHRTKLGQCPIFLAVSEKAWDSRQLRTCAR